MYSVFLNVKLYINAQQRYKSNVLSARKLYTSNHLKGAISEYKGLLHCGGHGYKKKPDDVQEIRISYLFFHKRKENA